MVDISKALAIANQHYRSGQFLQTEQACLEVLSAQPPPSRNIAALWQLLGMARQRLGKLEEAIADYHQAIDLNPSDARNYNNLGAAYKAQERFTEAVQAYEQALVLKPDYADVYSNLGNLFRQQGDANEAIARYQQALKLKPDHIDALHGLGNAYHLQGNYKQAVDCFNQALTINPNAPDLLNSLGNALQKMGKFTESLPHYQRAIALRPNDPAFFNNLGAALHELGRLDDSIVAYQQALKRRPNYADAYYNLGNNYREQDELAKAVRSYRQAIALKPNYPAAFNNLGLVLYEQGNLPDSIAVYQQALALRTDYPDAHLNMGLSLLQAGDLQAGFREYEWRWQVKGPNFKAARSFAQPQWDGSDLTGKTILLHAEQGFGDTIQFIRYAPWIVQRGGRIVLECQAPLVRLLQSLPSLDRIIPRGEALPDFQVHAPLMSLPHIFDTALDTVPAEIPYLTAPATPVLDRAAAKTLHVGIAWSGSPGNQNDRHRSCGLAHFLPLFQHSAVQFYCLQKDVQPQDEPLLSQYVQRGIIHDLRSQLGDFADTAAFITQIDLVIAVDTSIVHLAGALGCPVWVLLSFAPDWRWLQDRSDSPWYPTVRLFRQPQPKAWQDVFSQVEIALRSRLTESMPDPEVIQIVDAPIQESPPDPGAQQAEHPIHSIPDAPEKAKLIGIGWQLSPATGWGIYGTNLSLQLLKTRRYAPVPLLPPMLPNHASFNPLHWALLQPMFEYQQQVSAALTRKPQEVFQGNFLLLRGLGNQLRTVSELERISGHHTVGVIFFEDTNLTPIALEKAKSYDRIVAGSTWNADVLRSHGCTNVCTVFQGIDPSLFHAAPKTHIFWDRFVIFSGGKLEYRKGQDIVIKAFRTFQQRHPDALLITAWHNFWPQTIAGLDRSGHVIGIPRVKNGHLQIREWLVQNGIPNHTFIDLGLIPNHLVGQIVREADVAVFPNRCEGGTNLAAMESLACGVPTILSANTGHLDLVGDDHCYGLQHQTQVQPPDPQQGTDGWGESNVDELVEILEAVYADRVQAQKRGSMAAQWMMNWTWERQVQQLLVELAPLL